MYEDAGQLRRGRADAAEGEGRGTERLERLHAAGRLLQPPGRVRQDDGGARRARGEGAEQPGGVLHDRGLLLGEGLPRLPPEGRRKAEATSTSACRRPTRRFSSSPTTSTPSRTRTCCFAPKALDVKDPAKQQQLLEGRRHPARQGDRAAARRRRADCKKALGSRLRAYTLPQRRLPQRAARPQGWAASSCCTARKLALPDSQDRALPDSQDLALLDSQDHAPI